MRALLILILLVPRLAAAFDIPAEIGAPRTYRCLKTATAPVMDGRLDDPAWQNIPVAQPFIDIEGPTRPTPRHKTWAAMRWDDDYFYFGFRLEEPHLQASFTARDSYIYQQDNDIEIFIDPDGDNHLYYELELNALNTVWDLMLVKPYRDGAPAVHAWDIQGLKTAVHLEGTLNDGSDTDTAWSAEVAVPWDVLSQAAGRPAPPHPGHIWRVNFSRVQWDFEPMPTGGYRKAIDPRTGQHYPGHNWVWSPQGMIAMHMPENWGEVMFVSEDDAQPAFTHSDEHHAILMARRLMPIYYLQRQHQEVHGRFAADLKQLSAESFPGVTLEATRDHFQARWVTPLGTFTVNEEGRLQRHSKGHQ